MGFQGSEQVEDALRNEVVTDVHLTGFTSQSLCHNAPYKERKK
jgi:hypothetical protein